MLREEYVVEVIRGLCEKNEIKKWKLDTETWVYTAEINGEKASVCEGWRSLIFIKLQDESSSRTITEPMLMIRPNSPAWKISDFIKKMLNKASAPDKLQKMSIDMQFILEHAKKHATIKENETSTLLQKFTGLK